MKKEANFTLKFRHWLKTQKFQSAAFELKQTQDDYIPFSDIQDHQINGLLAAKSRNGILFKLPDDSRGIKPFDLFYLQMSEAYVVIKYPKFFCVIDIDDFLRERNESKRKSLTDIQAREIALKIVDN